MTSPHIWLRAETKPFEERTALTPANAKVLIDAGFTLTIESSNQNIFSDQAYVEIGCELVASGTWVDAPNTAIILGLKELPEADFPLVHRHIYFAHAYKEQQGWQALLARFTQGGGQLFDLEYLVDENNRRIAAFGYWAGYAGAALAALAWLNQKNGEAVPLKDIHSFENKTSLLDSIQEKLDACDKKPRILVIGAKGRSGCGAVALAKELKLSVVEWDIEETQKGGPFTEINDMDILVNCVFISGSSANSNIQPFTTRALLEESARQLSIITDVSCDPYGSYNPLPIYNECTTFSLPCLQIIEGKNPLSLIAIDHLPSLLPKESSEDYGEQLTKHLLTLNDLSSGVWPQALALFNKKSNNL